MLEVTTKMNDVISLDKRCMLQVATLSHSTGIFSVNAFRRLTNSFSPGLLIHLQRNPRIHDKQQYLTRNANYAQ